MTETENKEMKTETGEEKTEKKLVPRSGPAKKLKGAKRSDKSKNEDKMSSLDRTLAKQEEENRKANIIAAADPELHGKTRFEARAQEIIMALAAATIGSFA